MVPESSPDSANLESYPDLYSLEIIPDMINLQSYPDLDNPEIMSDMANLEYLTGLDFKFSRSDMANLENLTGHSKLQKKVYQKADWCTLVMEKEPGWPISKT